MGRRESKMVVDDVCVSHEGRGEERLERERQHGRTHLSSIISSIRMIGVDKKFEAEIVVGLA